MRDKTSITRDDNPEGINQYTGAGGYKYGVNQKITGEHTNAVTARAKELSKQAESLTKQAYKSGTHAAHITAAAAHREAEKAHENVSVHANQAKLGSRERSHANATFHHSELANYHDAKAGGI